MNNIENNEDLAEIMKAFTYYFEAKWQDNPTTSANLPRQDAIPKVPNEVATTLTTQIFEIKILKAINSMGCNRTLGLYGITISFPKSLWKLIIKEVCEAIMEFFNNKSITTREHQFSDGNFWWKTIIIHW